MSWIEAMAGSTSTTSITYTKLKIGDIVQYNNSECIVLCVPTSSGNVLIDYNDGCSTIRNNAGSMYFDRLEAAGYKRSHPCWWVNGYSCKLIKKLEDYE